MLTMICRIPIVALIALASAVATGEDWPTYRHDRLLSGVTNEKLQLPLENVWQFRARHATQAPKDTPFRLGWEGIFGDSKPLPEMMIATLPISAAGDSVFFTTTDGRAVCLDAATGKTRWEFVGAASMNCTPTFYEGKVYVGNDDGYVYCLDAGSGKLAWKSKAVSGERWFISFERMTSILPVRTNVLVDDGVAYFGTGVFPLADGLLSLWIRRPRVCHQNAIDLSHRAEGIPQPPGPVQPG
jgi:outer membrane protein assembly factor BamB